MEQEDFDIRNQLKNTIRISPSNDYVEDIRAILNRAREVTHQSINHIMVEAYWFIGERIVIQEQKGEDRAAYGEYILQELSRSLTKTLGKGFSYSNLRNMRQFYQTYPEQEICYTLCSKLTWSHNRLIMRVSDEKARIFYLKECKENQWSVRQLERNIASFYYQRLLSSQSVQITKETGNSDIESFIKDPYVMEYLGLPSNNEYSEKELETALINNLQSFLLELGKGFSFVGRQYRISTETTHFYIDLVFYNYILKCFVLIEILCCAQHNNSYVA